jgi:Uma2 family endonuclease
MAMQRRLTTTEPHEQPQDTAPRTAAAAALLPPLENGDRLTRSEFERRYEAMPRLKRAELIEGVVYVGSPVRHDQHGQPDSDISGWIAVYRWATPGTTSANNTTARLDLDNEPQPDILLRIARGGRSQIGEDGYVEGAPELVVEIAASSASYDLHDKLRAYRRNGVQEYIIWRTLDRKLDWLALEDGTYRALEPDEAGIIRSAVFPGLWLAASALLSGDMATVLATVQQGIASPEHAAFVERLGGADATAPPQAS